MAAIGDNQIRSEAPIGHRSLLRTFFSSADEFPSCFIHNNSLVFDMTSLVRSTSGNTLEISLDICNRCQISASLIPIDESLLSQWLSLPSNEGVQLGQYAAGEQQTSSTVLYIS